MLLRMPIDQISFPVGLERWLEMARERSKKSHSEEALGRPDWSLVAAPHKIGYARVSTEEQNLDMQLHALRKIGVEEDDLFFEKVSATSKKRPGLRNAVRQCRRGDVFYVWRMDRVARSLFDLLAFLRDLEERGVGFISLTEQNRVDTTTPWGKLYIHIMGAIAEFERQLIVERTRAGVKRAQERGVRFGAKLVIDLEKADDMLRRRRSVKEVAEACGVSRQTVVNHFPKQKRDWLAKRGPLKSKAALRRKS